MSPQEAVHVSRIKVTPRSGKETLGTWWCHRQRGGRTQSRHKPTQEMELRLLHARSSKLHDRADGQRPRWRTDSLGGAADGGIRPENDCLSSRPQRALLGSVLDAGIYCLSRSRLLWFCSALSSLPGQVPTQDVNSAAEGGVEAAERTRNRLHTVTCYHPSYLEGWRDTDWFKTRVPDQTQKRPRFIQSVNRPAPSTPHERTPQTQPDFHVNGWAAAHANS